jgi:hypothetical protein
MDRIDLPCGWVGPYGDNEVEIVSTISDPVKVRLAVDEGVVESNLGSVSMNVRRGDGVHEEVAYVMGRLTGNTKRMGALYLATRGPNDAQPQERLYIDHTAAIFQVPIMAPGLGEGGGGGGVNRQRLESVSGRFIYQLQDDPAHLPFGKIIVYDTQFPGRPGLWTAVAKLTPEHL